MMNKKIADLKQRELALDVRNSFIVQAPAGSGKTELLIQRLLSLLGEVNLPEEVLAITFTRKSAGEILSRVIESLESAVEVSKGSVSVDDLSDNEIKTLTLAEAVIQRDKKLGWHLLDAPSRLRIQTIDSLCSDIASQMPILGGGLQSATISEDCTALYSEAVRAVSGMVEDDSVEGEALRVLLKHLDNNVPALERRLQLMLSKRDQWMRYVEGSAGDMEGFREFLELSLSKVVETMLGEVFELLPEVTHKDICKVASFAGSNVEGGAISSLKGLTELPSLKEVDKWRGLRELFMTGKGEWRKLRGLNVRVGFPGKSKNISKDREVSEHKELMEMLLTEFELYGDLRRAFDEVSLIPDATYSEGEWEILKNLITLLKVTTTKLEEVFRAQSKIDFQTVSMAALKALGSEEDPTELLLAIDMKLQHILVDEYQDTSRTQTDLLKTLTSGWVMGDGRTLFVVGDPMQSIYHFREADVGLFIEAGTLGIGSVKLKPIVLKSNFRSHEAVVDWVNDTFEKTFPSKDDSFFGAVTYSPSSPVISTPDKKNSVAKSGDWINTHLYEDDDDMSEALHIAEVVKKIHKEGNGESIAVLASARSHMMLAATVMGEQGVPFVSEDLYSLSDSPVVMDLMSLTAAVNHPKDRLHWLALLRSPICGLSLSDIHKIVVGKKKEAVLDLLTQQEEKLICDLSEDGISRVKRIKSKIEKALKYRGRVVLSSLIEGLWLDLGGPACYEQEVERESEEFFNVLMSMDKEVFSLSAVKEKLAKLFTSFNLSSEDSSSVVPVEFMTIHKAKGLEFDHVIVPGMGRAPGRQERRLMLWMESVEGLLLAPIDKKEEESKLYGFIKSLYRKKEFLEKTRLLYVASTRAKKGLYLFGHIKESEDQGVKGASKSFLSLIEHILNEDMVVKSEGGETLIGDESGEVGVLKKIKSSWQSPVPTESISSATDKNYRNSEIEKINFDWARSETATLGTVLHLYFMKIARDGLSKWSSSRIEGESKNMETNLIAKGLSKVEASKKSVEGIEILKKAIDNDKGRWILSASEEAECEKPISFYKDGRVVRSLIDRTFVEDNVRWIIDYKTGSHSGGGRSSFIEAEKVRYQSQMDRYEEAIIGAGEKREIKKALYYPAMGEFVEL